MTAVSIVVPCYNAQAFIADALASLQRQTLQDWECLVVDDCSTDGSVAVIMEMAKSDARIRPILLSVNGGASLARNAALDEAVGTWVTLLDADDLYAPDRLERLVGIAQTQNADMVFDDQSISEFPDSREVDRAFHWLDSEQMPYTPARFFVESACFGRSLNPGYMKPLFARTFIETHALRYDPAFRSGQDYLFYANAFAANPRCFATCHPGYIYRRRRGSLSRSGGQHLRGHARLSDEILRRYGSRLSPPVREALARRKQYFLNAAALHEFRLAVSARSWGAAVGMVVREPGLVRAAAAAIRRRVPLFQGSTR